MNGNPCSTVAGTGQAGYELNQLNTPTAVTISNAKMYIADAYNQRILRCDYDSRLDPFVSNCQIFAGVTGEAGSDASHLRWPADVLAQGSLIYVADRDNHRILKFTDTDSLPPTLNTQLGTPGEAYPVDPTLDPHTHVNQPWGMAVDAMDHNALYVAENWGYSLAKFNTQGPDAGKLAWRVPAGAGNYGSDLHHFGNFSGSNQGNIAVDSLHRIFVPDAGNHRVMVYKNDGTIFGQIGAGQPGSGPGQFACPNGVGISHAYIFVADTCNQRIQVFDLSFKYVSTIGQTGVAGADSHHFSNPVALAVDPANNNIFVVDQGNQRVQRCQADGLSTSFICTPFAGVSGKNAGRDFHYLNHPVGIAFDTGSHTVLISEEETSRVQVFNAGDGSYLTTISGEWGDAGGRVRMPTGLATDGNAWAYVADSENARILRFSPTTYPWTQVNINGFGSPYNQDVSGLTKVKVLYKGAFAEMLYALTTNPGAGARLSQVWRQLPDYTWQAVSAPGFGSPTNYGLSDMAYFSNSLYVGTYDSRGAQIWRCMDLFTNPCEKPSDWNLLPGPLGASPHNQMVGRMVVFNDKLFVSYLNWSGAGPTTTDGGEVWAYDGNMWDSSFLKLDATTTNAGHAISGMRALAASSDGTRLYAGTTDYLNSPATPAQLYRYTYNAGSGTWEWRRLKDNGVTDPNNLGINSLLDINGYLYVGTTNPTHGAMLYRYKDVDLSEETQVISGGLNSPQNVAISGMAAGVDRIYALTSNHHSGIQVLSAPISSGLDGDWSLLSIQYGFGNATNSSISGDSSLTFSPDGQLMAGACNDDNGASLWVYSADRPYHIQGHIHYSGAELTHIIVTLQPNGRTTSPNQSGDYIFENLLPGAYTLSAQYPLLSFSSPVQTVTIQSESVDGVDFTVASGGINLTQPSNGAQLTSLDPLTLQWDPGIGATSYSLQVAYVDSFSPLLKSVTQAATTFKLAGLSANKTYYWKVRKANGTPGPWSVTFSFKTPVLKPPAAPALQKPQNGTTLAAGVLAPGSFTWKPSTIPSGSAPVQFYHLQVSRLKTFIPLDIDEYSQGASTAFSPTANLTPNQVYYWRVRAFNTAGNAGAWSSTFSFKVRPVPPATASAYDTNTLQPGIHWTDPYCTGKYLVQVYKVSTTLTQVKSATVSTGAACEGDYKLSASLALNTKYEWHITTQGSNGSSLPLVNSFRTPSSVPGTPVLLGPAANLVIPANPTYPDWNPIFTWRAVTSGSPDNYQIQIASQPGFGSSVFADVPIQATTTPLQYQGTLPLAYNTSVYWRVRACDVANNCSIWSASRKLVTRPGIPVDLTSRANSVDTTFQWTDPGAYTHFANRYTLVIYSNPPTCTSVVKTLASSTTSTHLVLAAGTNYCAKVGGVGPSSSITSPYSAALIFKTVERSACAGPDPTAG